MTKHSHIDNTISLANSAAWIATKLIDKRKTPLIKRIMAKKKKKSHYSLQRLINDAWNYHNTFLEIREVHKESIARSLHGWRFELERKRVFNQEIQRIEDYLNSKFNLNDEPPKVITFMLECLQMAYPDKKFRYVKIAPENIDENWKMRKEYKLPSQY